MRNAIAMITGVAALLAGCQPSRDDLLADAAQRQAEVLRQAEAKQTLQAFGGTLIGKSEGEWGGEVAFREPDGRIYTVIADNSQGIFAMPYGVVALTGLAHGGINRGAVHLLTRPARSPVAANLLVELPGAPCDVIREGNQITMRIRTGYEKKNRALTSILSCYALRPNKDLVRYECPAPNPSICFG